MELGSPHSEVGTDLEEVKQVQRDYEVHLLSAALAAAG
jgi:hypothetical protein